MRGVITVLVVVFSFGLALIQLFVQLNQLKQGGSISDSVETLVPPWVAGILGSVVSMYFQGRGGEVMRDKTNDTKDMMRDLSGNKEANRR